MSISELKLINFRGFRQESIQLKPLTVLLGPNSAGKSAFAQALAAMAHAHRAYGSGPQASLTPPKLEIDNWPVDLGQTRDLRTHGAEGPVRIGLKTREGWIELGFGGLEPLTADLLISYISVPSGEQSAPSQDSSEARANTNARSEGLPPRPVSLSAAQPSVTVRRVNEIQWQENGTNVYVILSGLVVKAIQHESGTARTLSGAATKDLAAFLETLAYLRANRKRPTRGYAYDFHKQQPIGYSGEWAPSILLRDGGSPVTYRMPPAVPNSIEQAKAMDFKWREKKGTLRSAIGDWLAWLTLATTLETIAPTAPESHVKMRVTLSDQVSRDITEIGFGVSQVIPILIAGLQQPAGSLFIVDLPEAHLHPRPQSAIADFFCSLALSGRSTLIETHSEMFFHRLRLRATMDPWLMENTAVYFIDPAKDGVCSSPRLVELGQGAELRWPPGFLQEAWESATQIKAVRQATRQQGS